MKRLFSAFLCIMLLVMHLSTSLADTLDKAAFEKLEGYSYDKFDKSWIYTKDYIWQNQNRGAVISIHVIGGKEIQPPPMMSCAIVEEKNKTTIREITGIKFLIDEDVYSFSVFSPFDNNPLISALSSTSGSVSDSVLIQLGEETKDFFEAMSKANSMSIRIETDTYNIDGKLTSRN